MLSALRSSVNRTISKSFSTTLINTKEPLIDPTQAALLNEKCFLVDTNDNIIGQANKKECHLVQPNGDIPLHRAFSVFLFNKRGDLLLQKRSSHKIIYPEYYTNSCIEHPVADFPGEHEESNAIGVKRAALRRLNHELGIKIEKIPIEKLQYITRIYYKDKGDGKWGEHEINYILFLQIDLKFKLSLKPNPTEVSEISFVPRNELDQYIPTLIGPITPWFQMILRHRLRIWWDHLNKLDEVADHKNIHELPVTYANTYTNSCCSHPIADYPEEAENVIGTKKAAIRRLNYELGIPKEQLHLDQLQYMTRILYKDEGDGVWGEHELDYVFILQSDLKIKPNSNEISEISYVPRAELDFFLKEMRDPFTPWFMIILKHRLRLWWDNLDRLEDFADHDKIYHFKK